MLFGMDMGFYTGTMLWALIKSMVLGPFGNFLPLLGQLQELAPKSRTTTGGQLPKGEPHISLTFLVYNPRLPPYRPYIALL